MKNLHFLVGLVALFGASAMAQGIKSSNDPMGDLISFVTKGKEIRSAKARAMNCRVQAQAMQRQAVSQAEFQSWDQLRKMCEQEIHIISRIQSENFITCANKMGPANEKACNQHFMGY